MAPRHRTPSEDLGPAILEAAEALLEKHGPDALSIRRIAQRARVAPMGLYTRFDGKRGVVDALFMEGFSHLGSAIRATSTMPDPVEAFRTAGRAYRELALAHPARYRLMFLHVVQGFEPSDEALGMAHGAFQALVEAAARCVDAGRLRGPDAAAIAQQVWATCHGWVALELGGINFAPDLAAGYDELLELLLRGLAAPDAPMASGHRPSRSGDSSIEV
jgi:AcrR family transcriptional regulator